MSPFLDFPSRRKRGVALVTVLALVVIVSLILVAFVAAMRIERTASQSYSQSISAEHIGMGALNLVVGELQNEMSKDASPDLTFPKKPLYTNVTSTNIMPQYVGTNAAMSNLVKISSTLAPYSGGAASGKLIATGIKTSVPARNGRFISTGRWDLPQLGRFPDNASVPNWVMMTRSGATNAAGITFGSTGNTLNNPSSGNPNYAVGRFAYAIYDVGGLMDITQAGYPTSLSPDQVQQIKGSLSSVLIEESNFFVHQPQLLNWRNTASAASASTFLDYVKNYSATNSVGAVYPGDNTFLSRQDLINAAKNGIAGLSTNALPNLTTFTRDCNAPSWGPTYNASELGGTNSAVYNYRNNASSATASPFSSSNPNPNRFLPGVRFNSSRTITDYRSDGSPYTYDVVPGDAVVQRRFPLSRLSWVGPNGPANGVSATAVQACFGLVWGPSDDPNLLGTSIWKYVGSTGTTRQQTIKTLDQVANEGRIPNFFELLQAAVLRGSLGLNGDAGGTAAAVNYSVQQRFPVFQILRMGAAAIDQADADSYPTVIEYEQSGYAWQACGVESLPGLVSISPILGAPSTPAQTEGETSAIAAVYLSFNLWNPHQQVAVNAPAVRIRARGSIGVYNIYGDAGQLSQTMGDKNEPGFLSDVDVSIELTDSGRYGFSSPSTILTTDVISPGSVADMPSTSDSGIWVNSLPLGTELKADVVALRLRNFPFKLGSQSVKTSDKFEGVKVELGYDTTNPFNVCMEFLSPSGKWVPYQFMTGMNDPLTWFRVYNPSFYIVSSTPHGAGGFFANYISYLGGQYLPEVDWQLNPVTGRVFRDGRGPGASPPGTGSISVIQNTWDRSLILASNDPRSTRFNFWAFTRDSNPVFSASKNMNLWLSSYTTPYTKGFGGANSALVSRKPAIFGTNYYPAQLSRNNNGIAGAIAGTDNSSTRGNTGTETSYTDNDGLRRIADSGLFVSGAATGNPFERVVDRPMVLNRPFNSVGELGFVFRDGPWKTLDLFTSKSADSALLDVFTVQDSESLVVAGRINLNTRNRNVLAALFSNVVVDPSSGTILTASRGEAMTDAVSQFTSTNKLINRSQLANLISPYLGSSSFGGIDDENIKPRREAFVRALSDVTQTRTWNLMIDIIAQTGRYSQASSALDQFTVEGERRYWLHVAIDRFTGEVLDRKIEVVTE